MSSKALIFYCGLLMTVSAVSIDIILPAFSLISADLSAPYAQVQLVVPVFILASGIGQIIWGPASDRFGRKKCLITGLSIFVSASLACWIAPTIETMLAGRFIQGLAASSGPVLARAVLRDMFSGRELAHNIAFATMIFALGPIVAPLVGVSIMYFSTWRVLFLIVLVFGAILLLAAVLRLPETIVARDKNALNPGLLGRNVKAIFANRQSRFFVLMAGPVMAMMMIILTSLPSVFNQEYAINGAHFAILFAIHGLGIIAGQYGNRRIIKQFGTVWAMLVASAVLAATTATMMMLEFLGLMGPYLLTACITMFATSYLIVMANSGALTLDPHGSIAGFVSSFFGFVSQAIAALIAMFFSILIGGDAMVFATVLFCLAFFTLVMMAYAQSERLGISS